MSEKTTYLVTLGTEEPVAVALSFDPDAGCWFADIEGERLALRLRDMDGQGRVVAELDGELIALELSEDDSGMTRLGFADEASEAALPVRARTMGEVALSAPRGGTVDVAVDPVVRSPITGEILDVLVAVGDVVTVDQGLILLEAMKMEMVVRTPGAGRVKEVLVKVGEPVKSGAGLVEIAPMTEGDAS